jgi:Nuclease A inhibitor-like protein
MPETVLDILKKATQGLLYPSEYDEPLEPFVWEQVENTPAAVRRLAGERPRTRCRTVAAEAFFGELAEVEGFPALYETLTHLLMDLKVYKFGATNLTIYVVGRDAQGRLAGFKTRAVET